MIIKKSTFPENLILATVGEGLAHLVTDPSKLLVCLDDLPPRLNQNIKELVLLRFEHKMSYLEVGRAVGISNSRARHIVELGLRQLKHPRFTRVYLNRIQ